MKRILPDLMGLLLCFLGSIVILGWYFHIPSLISIIPGYINMVFNTALCFALSGLALYLSQKNPSYQNKIYTFFGMCILVIAGLNFLEYALHQSFGIDQLFIKVWLLDQNPYPGRMAINTSVAFSLTGLSLLLFPYAHKQSVAILIQIIIFSIMLLGISALLGYLLKLEFLYSWYVYTRMAIHTSIGISILSIALWMTWTNSLNFSNLYQENEDKKIILLSTMILISITGIAFIAGYTIANNPVINQIELIIIILATSISIGISLLYWQVLPLINQLLLTKKNAIENYNHLKSIFDHAGEGIITIDVKGMIESFNNAAIKMFGYNDTEVLGKNLEMLIPHDLREKHHVGMKKYLETNDSSIIGKHSVVVSGLRKNTEQFPMELSITEMQINNERKFIGMMHDISERKAAEERLSFKAYYDTLTGLVNRNQLEHSLDLTISSALRHQQRFAIFFIDLDHFKHVNDSLGHDAGDELLKIIGNRLKSSIRKTDIAARLGGDEFILVLNGADSLEAAIFFAEKILNVLLSPIKIKEHEIFITASIGISFYPLDGNDYQSLIKSADLALYKAKESGRNSYQFCTPEMNREIQEKVIFKKALKSAMNRQEFYLAFSPKIDIKNSITGFETLLRWKNERYGDVSPSIIIPLAEEMGIINQLDDWIMRSSIEQGLRWKNTFNLPIKIIINISAKHYLHTEFVNDILNELHDMQFSPSSLSLEINETLIMQDPDYSMTVLRYLKNNGIEVIIDNFGTGYSSLNHLSQFSVDYVKIDRQFTRDILENHQHRELLVAMIALSKKLNIKIIAEGVESMEQFQLLSQLGCDEYQGYYISKPLIAEEVFAFVEQHIKKIEHVES